MGCCGSFGGLGSGERRGELLFPADASKAADDRQNSHDKHQGHDNPKQAAHAYLPPRSDWRRFRRSVSWA
jgi:hypothetical protein